MFAVIDSEMEYKKDLDGNVRVFNSVKDARLHFTVGTFGYTECKEDETVLLHQGNKLKIVPYHKIGKDLNIDV